MSGTPYNGSEGGQITETVGKAMVQRFQTSPLFSATGSIKSVFFGRTHIEAILAQANCEGVRVYFGMDDGSPEIKLVLTGADAARNDLLTAGQIYDMAVPCPSRCPSDPSKSLG